MRIDIALWRRIVLVSIIRFVLSLYYAYMCLGENFIENEAFLRVFLGGIQIEDSANLFFVMLSFSPTCLFFLFVTNCFIKDVKSNFIYIFLRTPKRVRWLNTTILQTIKSILCYEAFFGTLVLLLAVLNRDVNHCSLSLFFEIVFVDSMQLFMLSLFSNALYLFFTDTGCVFGTVLELVVPLFAVGVAYESNFKWENVVKMFPLEWGNYNYLIAAGMDIWVSILGIVVVCLVIYMVQMWKIKVYELL